jgi:hypothetical protein
MFQFFLFSFTLLIANPALASEANKEKKAASKILPVSNADSSWIFYRVREGENYSSPVETCDQLAPDCTESGTYPKAVALMGDYGFNGAIIENTQLWVVESYLNSGGQSWMLKFCYKGDLSTFFISALCARPSDP